MGALERLSATRTQNAHQIDHAGCPLDGLAHAGCVADVTADQRNLSHLAQRLEVEMLVWAPCDDPDPVSIARQASNNLLADEAGTAKNRHKLA
jgi:hypothetical protein